MIGVEPLESTGPDGALGAARRTPDFQNLQRNKRSLTLKDRECLAIFCKLFVRSDVVVENFRPVIKERFDIDNPKLKEINLNVLPEEELGTFVAGNALGDCRTGNSG